MMASITIPITDPLQTVLTFITIILIIPFVIKNLKIPEIVGFIFMGLIIGPYGLNVIKLNSAVLLLESIGILYIMYIAGLELDIDQFLKVKYKSIFFGILTGFLPGFILFAILFFYMKFSFLSSILLGDIIASHTVMTYPIISQIGVNKDEAVVISIGATMLTDTLSLLLLSIIVVLNANSNGITVEYLLSFVLNLSIFVIVALVVLPRLARFFFSKHRPTETEFQFALFVMLSTAVLANFIGLEGIIGAFIGGLAINRLIPKESRLMRLTEFIGKAFFIPIFIIYIGMLVNISSVFQSFDVIYYAILLIASLFIGKFVAAWIVSKFFSYSHNELIVIFSLTIPQVGATLATLFVGQQIGLISLDFLSAGIIMVVVTNFLAPLITSKYAPHLIQEKTLRENEGSGRKFGNKIVIPFSSRGYNKSVIDFSGLLAKQTSGKIYPLIVIGSEDNPEDNSEVDSNIKELVALGNEFNVETKPIKRVEHDYIEGILNTMREIDANLLIFNWKEYDSKKLVHFSNLIDQVIIKTRYPIIITKISVTISSILNLILIITDTEVNSIDFNEYLTRIKFIIKALNKKLVIYDLSHYNTHVKESIEKIQLSEQYDIIASTSFSLRKIKKDIRETDLIVLNFPLNHPLVSNESFTSSNTYYYATINSPNPLVILYFPTLFHYGGLSI